MLRWLSIHYKAVGAMVAGIIVTYVSIDANDLLKRQREYTKIDNMQDDIVKMTVMVQQTHDLVVQTKQDNVEFRTRQEQLEKRLDNVERMVYKR